MNKTCHQQWAELQGQVCCVPSTQTEAHVYVLSPRTGKRITLIGCLRADGSFLKPLIVGQRNKRDIDLVLAGVTNEKVGIYSQSKGCTDTPIFLVWFTDIFLPELTRRRQAKGYEGRVDLMMDNCPTQARPQVDETFAEQGVMVYPLPPNSSNQVQPLDFFPFRITKRTLREANRMETVGVQSSHIAQVLCSFMSAASRLDVLGTFSEPGLPNSQPRGNVMLLHMPGASEMAPHSNRSGAGPTANGR
jgi:hypothetical protein